MFIIIQLQPKVDKVFLKFSSHNFVVCFLCVIMINQGVQRRMVLVVNFFVFLKSFCFCIVAAICDLVHDMDAIYDLCWLLTTSGNVF